jgi:toxin CptA
MLRLEIRRSRQLTLLFGGVHAAALGAVLAAGLAWWIDVLAGVLLLASSAHALALHAWQSLKMSIVALELSDDCRLKVQDRRGEWRDGEVLASSFVAPRLTVLNLRLAGERLARHVILVPDRVDAEMYRRLRVLLRWKCGSSAPEARTLS